MAGFRVSRRGLVRMLPAAALPFVPVGAALADENGCGLAVNAVDSLYHYQLLVERVTTNAALDLGKEVERHYVSCEATVSALRSKLDALRTHLHRKDQWPVLQRRFETVEQSLEQMKPSSPGGVNAEAIEKQLPATLDALRLLMDTVKDTCRADDDHAGAALVDAVFSALKESNDGVEQASGARTKWENQRQLAVQYRDDCSKGLTAASLAIADEGRTSRSWTEDAAKALDQALADLKNLTALGGGTGNADGKDNAGATLELLIGAARQTLRGVPGGKTVAYEFGGDQAAKPAAVTGVTQSNPVLVQNVRALVNNRKFFEPGCLTQVVNTIAVCWPVWVMYSTGKDEDVKQGKKLIASALFFELIRGTVWDAHGDLTEALWQAYGNVTA